ncbi:MAG TPA: beta-glucanase [Mariniphaga anaerophila]|uniref:Beta-glucanase n=1 Tax=Mariniphaga anaerophila TaxID=1484053 RepID=A0A831PPU2_9BACT|nr:beta-glucanase [Mariniphaga anaerophila]
MNSKNIKQWVLLAGICLALLSSCNKQPEKALAPGEIWPDNNGMHINAHGGGILHHNNTFYWYGEHKIEGEIGNTAQVGVHVYSSKNLYDWVDEGIALKVDEDEKSDIARGCILERPKVIFNKKTGKFVMWFHLELKDMGYDAARSGVAVAEKPEGPFTFIRSMRPNAGHWPVNVQDYHLKPVHDSIKPTYCGGKGCLPAHPDTLNLLGRDYTNGQMARDMNLFVDDDGTAYHIYSSEDNSTLHISQLTDDYLSHSGKFARFFADRYMEAPAIFKTSGGTYYLIASDCTGWAPNAARSARAKSIWGPWEELGNPSIGPDADLTFHSQSTYVLPVPGEQDKFIYMGDRWKPENPIDGRYIWLPIQLKNGYFEIEWKDNWNVNSAWKNN